MLLNMNIKLDSLWSYPEVMSLTLSLSINEPVVFVSGNITGYNARETLNKRNQGS